VETELLVQGAWVVVVVAAAVVAVVVGEEVELVPW
jgi:hypothetical protein